MPKYKVKDKEDKLLAQVEVLVLSELMDDWKQELNKEFKKASKVIEDWQNLDEVELGKLKNRMENITDKDDPLDKKDCVALGLYSMLYWNEVTS